MFGRPEELRRRRSFEAYVGVDTIEGQGNKAEAWALSSESSQAYDIFARIATAGALDFKRLQEALGDELPTGANLHWLARLGRIVALQASSSNMERFALAALRASVPSLPQTGATLRLRRVFFEVLFSFGHDAEASELLSHDPALDAYYHGYLGADLLNPYRSKRNMDHSRWLEAFNRPMTDSGIIPVAAAPDALHPFDTLQGRLPVRDAQGPLVSVVLTTYNPVRRELTTAVESILRQSWVNLELIIVDDFSANIEPGLLDEVAALDNRIRVVRLEANGGTYIARNAGIASARGDYITGQDTDDWSHPQRIERQVAHLVANPHLPGVMTVANRTNEELVRTLKGSLPERRCEVSLLYRRSDAETLGGYLPVRKAGDSEFRSRLEAYAGREVGTIRAPLYLIRLSEGSLSRADFRGGWSHPARRGFRNMYTSWHDRADKYGFGDRNLRTPAKLPFAPPRRILGEEPEPREYDAVFVADWRANETTLAPILTELVVASRHGVRVGILQQESPFLGLGAVRDFNPKVGKLLASGAVELLYTDEEASVKLVIVRDPSVIDFAKEHSSKWVVDSVAFALSSAPMLGSSEARTFDPEHATAMATLMFGVQPMWYLPPTAPVTALSESPAVRQAGEAYPFVVDSTQYKGVRKTFRRESIVLGRSAVNSVEDWPSNREALEAAYPFSGEIDVRVLGDARGAIRAAQLEVLPAGWLSFRDREVRCDVFWRRIDFCVQYDRNPDLSHTVRDLLHALAAGVVVIGDAKYSQHLGDVMLAVPALDVPETINAIANDPELYQQRSEAGQRLVEYQWGGESFVRFLSRATAPADSIEVI